MPDVDPAIDRGQKIPTRRKALTPAPDIRRLVFGIDPFLALPKPWWHMRVTIRPDGTRAERFILASSSIRRASQGARLFGRLHTWLAPGDLSRPGDLSTQTRAVFALAKTTSSSAAGRFLDRRLSRGAGPCPDLQPVRVRPTVAPIVTKDIRRHFRPAKGSMSLLIWHLRLTRPGLFPDGRRASGWQSGAGPGGQSAFAARGVALPGPRGRQGGGERGTLPWDLSRMDQTARSSP